MLRKVNACRDRTSEGTVWQTFRDITELKCPYHVIFDLDLDLDHTLDAGYMLWTIVCKFGGDPVMFVVEEAICAKKFTDRQSDDGRLAIA